MAMLQLSFFFLLMLDGFYCQVPQNSFLSPSSSVQCNPKTAPSPQYASAMNRLLDILQKSAHRGYRARLSLDTGQYKLFGEGSCEPKLDDEECVQCVLDSKNAITLACSNSVGGLSSNNQCKLEFQDASFW